MASGFFVLLRFFLRVDGVLVRMNDTRIYHQVRAMHSTCCLGYSLITTQAGTNHLIREYTSREARTAELKVYINYYSSRYIID